MERPEALEAGHVILSGLNSEEVLRAARYQLSSDLHIAPIGDYSVEDTSKRVISFIFSTIGQYKFWKGLR
jgi:UDP-N-acetylglucosamine 2-epimerase (non-hydrolysing)